MLLSEVFSQLSYGELTNLALAGPDGKIPKEKYERMVNHVNLGLTDLHKRFLLQAKDLVIDLVPDQTQYILKAIYQKGNPEGARFTQYIRQSSPMFANDIILIEQVFSDKGKELALNDETDPYSIRAVSMNTIRVPDILIKELNLTSVRVTYRANHERIVWEDKTFDPEDYEIELPDSHLQALLYYIASRVHNPVGFNEQMHEGNNYAAKYERECGSLLAQNLRVDTGNENSKPRRRGWA